MVRYDKDVMSENVANMDYSTLIIAQDSMSRRSESRDERPIDYRLSLSSPPDGPMTIVEEGGSLQGSLPVSRQEWLGEQTGVKADPEPDAVVVVVVNPTHEAADEASLLLLSFYTIYIQIYKFDVCI